MIDIFDTKNAANEGITVHLFKPDGKPTKYWLKVLGIDSDVFRQRQTEANRNQLMQEVVSETAKKNGSADPETVLLVAEKFHADAKQTLLAHIVIDWNITDTDGETVLPCTLENVKELYRRAPQIQDQVDRLVANRGLFLELHSKVSTHGAQGSSH